jgi:hypothetical protein
MDRVAVLVVSHNYPQLTDSLCEKIIECTKNIDYDLYVIETGSQLNLLSKYTSLWVSDGCRMTRGFNLLKQYADFTLQNRNNQKYDAYILFVNDAKFIDNKDLISIMYEEMKSKEDCGQIHPYQQNILHPYNKMNKMTESETRKESFVEFICPMISRVAWEKCGPNLLDNRFFYGWGLDYDIPFQMHLNGYRTYITDKVGILHNAFTSYINKDITKEELQKSEFIPLARSNMSNGMIEKYGENWMKIMYNSIPSDVSKELLFLWLSINDGFKP